MMYATYPQMLQKKNYKADRKKDTLPPKEQQLHRWLRKKKNKKKKTIKAKRQWNYVFSVLEKKPINLKLYIQQKYFY